MNDDLLKKEATTDSRSETFSSIMKVRGEKRERDKEETEEGGVGKRKRREGDRGERRREEEVEKRVHCFSFFSSHCVTYAQSFLVVMTLRHFVSK